MEIKEDIAAIREAVQEIDRSVAKIKGFLGSTATARTSTDGAATPTRPSRTFTSVVPGTARIGA